MGMLHLLVLLLSLNMSWAKVGHVGNMMETYGSIKEITDLGSLDILNILGDYLTPRGENVTSACLESGETYKKMLAKNHTWAMQMFDADPKFPQEGLMDGNILHFPGAFDECSNVDSGTFWGKYCLMGLKSASILVL